MIITNLNVYNVKGKKKIKRAIQIEFINGISRCLAPNSKEFTIHVQNDYDYRFFSEK